MATVWELKVKDQGQLEGRFLIYYYICTDRFEVLLVLTSFGTDYAQEVVRCFCLMPPLDLYL